MPLWGEEPRVPAWGCPGAGGCWGRAAVPRPLVGTTTPEQTPHTLPVITTITAATTAPGGTAASQGGGVCPIQGESDPNWGAGAVGSGGPRCWWGPPQLDPRGCSPRGAGIRQFPSPPPCSWRGATGRCGRARRGGTARIFIAFWDGHMQSQAFPPPPIRAGLCKQRRFLFINEQTNAPQARQAH